MRARDVPSTEAAPEPPTVERWLPSRGRECIRRGKYKRFCQGPRRAPAPHGEAGALAQRLHLGDRKSIGHLLIKPPLPEWLAAAGATGEDARPNRLTWPVRDGKLWRGFGRVRRGPKRKRLHRGLDIGAPQGTPIMAVQDGLVAYADNGVRGYGNMLAIIHPDATVTFYAHCKAIYVFPGQRVARGQRVADVGHTGIARGSHLHFEYRRRGRPRDPLKLFDDPVL